MRIVLTGAFKADGTHITRKFIAESAADHGHTVEDRVCYLTDMVVVGDTGHWKETNKIRDAKAFGIPVVSAQYFYENYL